MADLRDLGPVIYGPKCIFIFKFSNSFKSLIKCFNLLTQLKQIISLIFLYFINIFFFLLIWFVMKKGECESFETISVDWYFQNYLWSFLFSEIKKNIRKLNVYARYFVWTISATCIRTITKFRSICV